jgi:hypothetical protein
MDSLLKISVLAACFVVGGLPGTNAMPTRSMQILDLEESQRRSVSLEVGDCLQVVIPNGSGAFAEALTVDAKSAPVKFTRSAFIRQLSDDGHPVVGSSPIALLFDAEKVGAGEVVIRIQRGNGGADEEIHLTFEVEKKRVFD